MLAIPSVIIGYYTVSPVLFGDYFGKAIFVLEQNNVIGELAHEFHGPASFALHALPVGALSGWRPPGWSPRTCSSSAIRRGRMRQRACTAALRC